MIQEILLLLLGAAVVTIVGSAILGQSLPEVLFNWWSSLFDRAMTWLHRQGQGRIVRLGIAALSLADGAVIRGKQLADRVNAFVYGVTAQNEAVKIDVQQVSSAELLTQFPEMQGGNCNVQYPLAG